MTSMILSWMFLKTTFTMSQVIQARLITLGRRGRYSKFGCRGGYYCFFDQKRIRNI